MATSICPSSGSLVVSIWNFSPGHERTFTNVESLLPAHLSSSYEIPATNGSSMNLESILIQGLGHPTNENIIMLMIITNTMKLVPHLGWRVVKLDAFSTVSSLLFS